MWQYQLVEMPRKSINETKTQELTYTEHEMCDYTGTNCSHRNSNKRFKGKFGSHTKKTLNRFITNDSYTCNIAYNKESTAV
jgi:hypothetical protein